jgi:hypothetical protein
MRQILFTLFLSSALLQPAYAFTPGHYVDDMWIDEGEQIVTVEPQAGTPLTINGWTRRGRGDVYLEVDSKSAYLLLAVFDFAKPDDEAIFFSEPDNRKTTLTIKSDTELLIRPILILGQPRRGLGVNYQLRLLRQGS